MYFEDPFWAGVFERVSKGKLSVAKVTFGAKPREQDVYRFILDHYYDLQFSPAVAAAEEKGKAQGTLILCALICKKSGLVKAQAFSVLWRE